MMNALPGLVWSPWSWSNMTGKEDQRQNFDCWKMKKRSCPWSSTKLTCFFERCLLLFFFSGECTALGLCVISCFLTITFAIVRRPLFADACVSNWLCCLSRKLAAMNSLYIYAQDPGSVTWRDSVWFWPHLCQEGEKEDIFEPPPNNVEASYTY